MTGWHTWTHRNGGMGIAPKSKMGLRLRVTSAALSFPPRKWSSLQQININQQSRINNNWWMVFNEILGQHNNKHEIEWKSSKIVPINIEMRYEMSMSVECCLLAFGMALGLSFISRRRKQWKPSHSDSEAVTIFQPENSFFIYISSCGLIFMWLLFKFLALSRRFNALLLMCCQLEREFQCADSDWVDLFGHWRWISPTVQSAD